ncbi:MAG: tRNA pseudouridine(55) synthase, partial [Limisphaerales bacterium]
ACTKGTYIRSIAHDLGQKIGCGAHLKTLRRTVSGSFNVRKAYRLERILEMEIADLSKALIPLDQLRESTLTG